MRLNCRCSEEGAAMVALGQGSGNIFQKSRVLSLEGEVEVRCFNAGTEAAEV